MSRLTIDVTEQQHQALKAMAALSGKSIKQYALEQLLPDDEAQALADLKAILLSRLARADLGEVSSLCAEEIIEEVIQESKVL